MGSPAFIRTSVYLAKRDNPDPDPGLLHAVFRDESKSSFGKRDTEIPCSEKRSPHGNKNRYFLEKFQSGKVTRLLLLYVGRDNKLGKYSISTL